MSEEIRDLIIKIQKEGVQAAESKARGIEDEAKSLSEKIIANSNLAAQKIIKDAEEEARRHKEGIEVSLRQAGRDFLISLRKEIESMLDKVVKLHIRQALGPDELAKIIASLVKESGRSDPRGVEVILPAEELRKIKEGLIGKLSEEIKKGVVLKASDDLKGGFRISFDAGKSSFDFSDKALAEYIGSYLKKELAGIL